MNTNVTNIQLIIIICHFLPNKITECMDNQLFSSRLFYLLTVMRKLLHNCEETFSYI